MCVPGFPSSILRWICHIPTGYVAITASSHYYGLVDLSAELLDDVGTGHALVLGMQLTSIVVRPTSNNVVLLNGVAKIITYQLYPQGWTVFAWNFVQFPVSPMMRGVLLWLTGFVDLVFAILLTASCAKIGSFLPHSIAGCGQAANWRNTVDGRNLFVELVGIPDGFEGVAGEREKAHWAGSTCKDMVTVWIVTIVVV